MSIVEQAVDSLKSEEAIKEISSHENVIKLVSKELLPIKMDLDVMETSPKIEKQTNGSASTLKDTVDDKTTNTKNNMESLKNSANVVAGPDVEPMDVDIATNGNGVKIEEETVEKEDKETDDNMGDCETGGTGDGESETRDKPKHKVDESSDNLGDMASKLETHEVETKESKLEAKDLTIKVDVEESKVEKLENNAGIEMSENKEKEAREASVDKAESNDSNNKNKEETEEKENKKVDITTNEILTESSNNIKTNNQDANVHEKTEVKEALSSKTSEKIDEVENKKDSRAEKHQTNDDDIKTASDIDKPTVTDDKTETCSEKKAESNEPVGQLLADQATTEDKEMKECDDVTENHTEKCNALDIANVPEEKKTVLETTAVVGDEEEMKEAPSVEKSEVKHIEKGDTSKEDSGCTSETIAMDVAHADDEVKPTENSNCTDKITSMKDKPLQVETVDAALDAKSTCDNDTTKNEEKSFKQTTPNDEDQEMVETNTEDIVQSTEQPESTTEEQQHPPQEDQEMAEISPQQDTAEVEPAAGGVPVTETIYVDDSCYFENGKIVELSRIAWSSKSEKQQYVRGCLWSPDGTCILTAVNMDGMHVMNLPNELYANETVSADRPLDKLESVINVKEGGTVYDFCWYPFMNSTLPETCCWVSSRQHCPIQLWDGFTGDLRGSYRGYDNADEVEAAFSVTFTSDAEKIIGGYKKTLKIFDTKSPGREYSVIPIKQPCSCFAVQKTQSNIIATGSWNCAINLYDLRAPKLGSLVTFEKHSGGVTFLKFMSSGDSLLSGARKDNNIFEWDMRNFSEPIRQLNRNVKTNQRIYFDLSPDEKWLVSGDTEGLVRVWDLKSTEQNDIETFSFGLHRDCCNGVSFHPSRPMLATCSGQYHFLEDIDTTEPAQIEREEIYENSLIFWWVGLVSEQGRDKGTVENPVITVEECDDGGIAEKMDA